LALSFPAENSKPRAPLMNRFFRYILKGRRDEYSVPFIIGRLLLVLMIGSIVFIVSFLGVHYMEGKRESDALDFLEKRTRVDSPITRYSTILPVKLDMFLSENSPDWFWDKTHVFHLRLEGLHFYETENFDNRDFARVRDFKYLRLLNYHGSELSVGPNFIDLAHLKGLPIQHLVLTDIEVANLSQIKDLPLSCLVMNQTQLKDLPSLEGTSIKELDISYNPVSDLSPLKGSGIEVLRLPGTNVVDLSPLKGLPLRGLWLDYTKVNDLSPLKGMPLTHLSLLQCEELKDLTPLAKCTNLKAVVIPKNIKDYDFLKELPNMETIYTDSDVHVEPVLLWGEH
jgi:hypothetical protein